MNRRIRVTLASVWLAAAGGLEAGAFPEIKNTQDPKEHPPTPAECVKMFTAPEGFEVTLFAAEPDLHQPIGFTLDDRGRLWVVENFTYKGDRFNRDFRDRILIFEDSDNDGQFNTRKVFWDQGNRMTSVELGFGGVWILNAETLSFIPDKNGDDQPDGKPVVLLDGFEADRISHNIANGLLWGPDGWLYGRQGIQATSKVGPPGTPDSARTKLNCSIWRYHPRLKTFEVVIHGTTNPWGLDYNDEGEFFFSNNVLGNLWHMIPGAYFIRMYGAHFNPYIYELMDLCSDHYHFDKGAGWTKSRNAVGVNNQLGGGHSHCGGLFYLADDWPKKYRNSFLTSNIHGRRINNDIPERKGAGYTARHGKDFVFANNLWFKGVELRQGPDGSVYLSDWTDLGECHDHDGVHRTSGRMYKITYGRPKKPEFENLQELPSKDLVDLQLHRNDWYVRQSRRILIERSQADALPRFEVDRLKNMLSSQKDPTRRLRALWCLYGMEKADEDLLIQQLGDADEHVRAWAVRLLTDTGISPGAFKGLIAQAEKEVSGLVGLYLASAIRHVDGSQKIVLAEKLLRTAEKLKDRNLTLIIWYGIEPAVVEHPEAALALIKKTTLPRLRRFIGRRLTENLDQTPEPVNQIIDAVVSSHESRFRHDVLQGMVEALKGRKKVSPPAAWMKHKATLKSIETGEVKHWVRILSGVFGDGVMLSSLVEIARDESQSPLARLNALRVLVENPDRKHLEVLLKLAGDPVTAQLACRGLAAFDYPNISARIVSRYWKMDDAAKQEAINTLSSRASYAVKLLESVEKGDIARADISAFHAQQMARLNDKKVDELLLKNWGRVNQTAKEKHELIETFRKQLTPKALAGADRSQGRVVWNQVCSACHTLYGIGGTIGPDLTGGNRDNLGYLLENIIDPNAILGDNFKTTAFTLMDGRTFLGAVETQNEHVITVRTQTDQVSIDRKEIKTREEFPISLMPEGLIHTMTPEQVKNLMAYLTIKEQAPLPEGETK